MRLRSDIEAARAIQAVWNCFPMNLASCAMLTLMLTDEWFTSRYPFDAHEAFQRFEENNTLPRWAKPFVAIGTQDVEWRFVKDSLTMIAAMQNIAGN